MRHVIACDSLLLDLNDLPREDPSTGLGLHNVQKCHHLLSVTTCWTLYAVTKCIEVFRCLADVLSLSILSGGKKELFIHA